MPCPGRHGAITQPPGVVVWGRRHVCADCTDDGLRDSAFGLSLARLLPSFFLVDNVLGAPSFLQTNLSEKCCSTFVCIW
jgi:hypothetical protein